MRGSSMVTGLGWHGGCLVESSIEQSIERHAAL